MPLVLTFRVALIPVLLTALSYEAFSCGLNGKIGAWLRTKDRIYEPTAPLLLRLCGSGNFLSASFELSTAVDLGMVAGQKKGATDACQGLL